MTLLRLSVATLSLESEDLTQAVRQRRAQQRVLEMTTLVAMGIYALFIGGCVRVLGIVLERTGARTVTRSTRQQTGGGPGNERTTHTTIND